MDVISELLYLGPLILQCPISDACHPSPSCFDSSNSDISVTFLAVDMVFEETSTVISDFSLPVQDSVLDGRIRFNDQILEYRSAATFLGDQNP